ncbi:Hypothetical predicted protein [Octopus vulgaris]|uniref:Uncharacterized protein n=1 Tax=Octopus vulgaris TaxID=6645 RepID=A0AA36AGV0_OCTVU|nr:Hypothetical predicted protein [Octopus vulgaris]
MIPDAYHNESVMLNDERNILQISYRQCCVFTYNKSVNIFSRVSLECKGVRYHDAQETHVFCEYDRFWQMAIDLDWLYTLTYAKERNIYIYFIFAPELITNIKLWKLWLPLNYQRNYQRPTRNIC